MIGAGCGIGLLVFLIFIFCAGICYLSYKSKRYAQSVINIRSMELQAAQGEGELNILVLQWNLLIKKLGSGLLSLIGRLSLPWRLTDGTVFFVWKLFLSGRVGGSSCLL